MHCSKKVWICLVALTVIMAGCQPKSAQIQPTNPAGGPTVVQTKAVTQTDLPAETPALPTEKAVTETTATNPTPEAVTSWPLREPVAIPPHEGSELYFSLVKRANENYQSLGVYSVSLYGGISNQYFGEGYQLQAISTDGNWLLVNQGLNLYVCAWDGSDPVLVSDSFSDQSLSPVHWAPDGNTVHWMELAGDQKLVKGANTTTGEISAAADFLQEQTAAIFSSDQQNRLSWLKGTCNSGNYCRGELIISTTDGTSSTSWGNVVNPVMDLNLKQLAFIEQGETDVLLKVRLGGSAMEDVILDMEQDIPVDYEWSPDGQTLVVMGQIRSDYSGKNYGNRLVAFRAPDWKPELLAEVAGLNARITFSADGQSVVISATRPLDPQGYTVEVTLINLSDKTMRIVDIGVETKMDDYIFIPHIWEK